MSPRVWRAWLNRLLGRRGEEQAARYLKKQGLRILTRGYRTRLGEIDLVAREGDSLVFVEVKTRRSGRPAEAVTPRKQRRIIRAASRFVRFHRLLEANVPCRFDVVGVTWPEGNKRPEIQHYRGAFEVPSGMGL